MVVRLRDVADLSGVSVKTVSNVVHGYVHVAPATRGRVQEALDELDYRPNLSARSLRRGRTGLIALAVPALDMPYFAELTRAVVDASTTRGWTVLVDQTDGLPKREREVVQGLRGHLIDGLIISPMALGAQDLNRARGDVPLVLLGEKVSQGGVDHVAVDNVAAASDATAHLVELGRRRIAAIGYQDPDHASSGVAPQRSRGYEEALGRAGLAVDPDLTPVVDGYRRADGEAAMHLLLRARPAPDAVFCFNDLLALGALRALRARGLRVPRDVAVVGFDDIEDGRYSNPSLTTIAPDKNAIARLAVEMLESRILGDDPPAREETVDHSLVVRESTSVDASLPPSPPPIRIEE
jgi:DNA-binding LacI/PurR family transcriptional regulator